MPLTNAALKANVNTILIEFNQAIPVLALYHTWHLRSSPRKISFILDAEYGPHNPARRYIELGAVGRLPLATLRRNWIYMREALAWLRRHESRATAGYVHTRVRAHI